MAGFDGQVDGHASQQQKSSHPKTGALLILLIRLFASWLICFLMPAGRSLSGDG
jgi:hypothetical protein